MPTGLARNVPDQREPGQAPDGKDNLFLNCDVVPTPGHSQAGRHRNKDSSNRPLKTSCSIPLCQPKEIENVYGVVRLEIDLELHVASSSVGLDSLVDFRNVVHPSRSQGNRPVDWTSTALPNCVSEGLADGVRLPRERHGNEAASTTNNERLQTLMF